MGTTGAGAGKTELDPRAFEDDLDRLLALLANAKSAGKPWMSAVDLSSLLRDQYGLRHHWRTAEKALKQHRTLADRRKRNGRWEFTILASGEERVTAAGAPIVMVDPASAVQSVLSLQAFLSGLRGVVR